MFFSSIRPKSPEQLLGGDRKRMQHTAAFTGTFGMRRCSPEMLCKITHYTALSSDPRDLHRLARVNWFFLCATNTARVKRWVHAHLAYMKAQANTFAKEEYLARVLGMIECLEDLPTDALSLELRSEGLLQLIKTMDWEQLPEGYVPRVCDWILEASKLDGLEPEARLRIRLQLAVTLARDFFLSLTFQLNHIPLQLVSVAIDDLDQHGQTLLQLVCEAHIYRITVSITPEAEVNGLPTRELFDRSLGRLKTLPAPKQLLALPELGIAARDDNEKIDQVLGLLKPMNVHDRTQVLLAWFRPWRDGSPAGMDTIPDDSELTTTGAGWDRLAPHLNDLLQAIAAADSLPHAPLLRHVAEALIYWFPDDLNETRIQDRGRLVNKLVGQCLQLFAALPENETRLQDLMAGAVRAVLEQIRGAASLQVEAGVEIQPLWQACFDEQGCASGLQPLLLACLESGREHPALPEMQRMAKGLEDLAPKETELVYCVLRAWAWRPGQEDAVEEGLAILKQLPVLPDKLIQAAAFGMINSLPVQAGRAKPAPRLDRRLAIALSSLPGWLGALSAERLIHDCPESDLGEVLANMLRHAAPRKLAKKLKVLCTIGITLAQRESLSTDRGQVLFRTVLQELARLPEPQRSQGLGRMLDKIRHALGRKGGLEPWFEFFLCEIAITSDDHMGALLLRLGKLLPLLPDELRDDALAALLQVTDSMPQESRQAWRLACRALAVDTACDLEQVATEFEKCEIIMAECTSLPEHQQHFLIQLCESRMERFQSGEEDSEGDVNDRDQLADERLASSGRSRLAAAAGSEDENDESGAMSLDFGESSGTDTSTAGGLGGDDMDLDTDDDSDDQDAMEREDRPKQD